MATYKSMLRVGFDSLNAVVDRSKTTHALDHDLPLRLAFIIDIIIIIIIIILLKGAEYF
jgi:hypothetical protein